jgi:Rad/Gem-related GTP binding protein 1
MVILIFSVLASLRFIVHFIEPHACVIVYSIVARSSFRVAEEILNYLWRENVTRDKAVIIVGNKADLARSRVISTQGNLLVKKLFNN